MYDPLKSFYHELNNERFSDTEEVLSVEDFTYAGYKLDDED